MPQQSDWNWSVRVRVCASSFGVIFHDGFGNRHFGLLVQKSRVVTVATLEGMHAFLQ